MCNFPYLYLIQCYLDNAAGLIVDVEGVAPILAGLLTTDVRHGPGLVHGVGGPRLLVNALARMIWGDIEFLSNKL